MLTKSPLSATENYAPYGLFLRKSLIMLDDLVPGYTIHEQFANAGLAFAGCPVATYRRDDFGRAYFQYARRERLSPKPLLFLDEVSTPQTIEALIDPAAITAIQTTVGEHGLRYLQPFMVTKEAVRVAKQLNLEVASQTDAINQFNDKIYMKAIAEEEGVRILGNHTAKTCGEARDLFAALHDHGQPVIFKSNFSCGGQGNHIIRGWPTLEYFLTHAFHEHASFVVEPMIAVKQTPCTLYFIDSSGAGHYLGMTDQIIKDGSACIGSTYPAVLSPVAEREVLSSSWKLAERIAQKGYIGPLGFDFVVDTDDAPFFLEANVRLNYSHCMLHLSHATGMSHGLLKDISPKKRLKGMDEVVDAIGPKDIFAAGKGGIFPFYPQTVNGRLDKFAVIVLGEDKGKVHSAHEACERIFRNL